MHAKVVNSPMDQTLAHTLTCTPRICPQVSVGNPRRCPCAKVEREGPLARALPRPNCAFLECGLTPLLVQHAKSSWPPGQLAPCAEDDANIGCSVGRAHPLARKRCGRQPGEIPINNGSARNSALALSCSGSGSGLRMLGGRADFWEVGGGRKEGIRGRGGSVEER